MKKGQKMPESLRLKRIEYMKAHPIKYWLGKKRDNYKLSESGRNRIIEALMTRRISDKVISHVSKLNSGGKAFLNMTTILVRNVAEGEET